jgi:addiction module HigA family antidote
MHNPPHPGEVLRGLYLEPNGLPISTVAQAIGVSRTALSQLINGHVRLTPTMAQRLAGAFRTSPDIWLNLQHEHDLWNTRKHGAAIRIPPLIGRNAARG